MQAMGLVLAAAIAAGSAAEIDFDTEVMPVLTRAGCNVGACHGAAIGRGGFKLSLLGSDPAADHDALVNQLEGRRINLAAPEESLMLLKPTGQIPHGGGIRLNSGEPGVQRIVAWLRAGAPRLQLRQLQRFKVTPGEQVLGGAGKTASFKARAYFDDGTTADVTRWAVFSSSDPSAVEIERFGNVKVLRRGQTTVMVRFLDRVVAARLIVPLGQQPVDFSDAARHNFIDDEVLGTLATLRIPVSPLADDWTFIRRVSLGLTGTLPRSDAVRAFVADRQPDKRSRLVDRLLESPEFVDYWSLKWGNLLRINSRSLAQEGARAFHGWIHQQVARGTPLDQMARDMLTASGDSFQIGPANFSRVPRDPRMQAEYVSRVLMGVRLRCANCHNHPFDRWTQDDYHGLAAVFARLDRGRVVRATGRGEVTHPRTGEPAVARLPGTRFLGSREEGRVEFAKWLTRPDNPYFARAAVNRLWKEMMGRGLVEPADDLRDTNPATHPALLDRLARDFVEHDNNVRHTLRMIAKSATYQRSARTTEANAPDDRFYSHALVRPLEAEVLADALAAVTGVSDRYGDEPPDTRAIALFDSLIPSSSLDILGRCSRTGPCEDEAGAAGGLARTLHLINGPLINRKISSPGGRVSRLLDGDYSDRQIIQELYLRALARLPTKEEGDFWDRALAQAANGRTRRQVFQDFLWSLLNCREFLTNH